MADTPLNAKAIAQTAGRVLFISSAGSCYISRKYNIYRSDDWGLSWKLDCRVPPKGWKSLAAHSTLAARLLRYNIQALQVLDDGTRVAVARDGLYRAGPGETQMTRTFTITRGSRPLNLAADGSRLLFGEYGDGFGSSEIFIYVSEDRGKTWEVGCRFPPGDIRHVHNIVVDPWKNHYWVLVGDFGRQPGIGALSKDLKTIDWLTRGGLESRAVGVILKPDCLIYGTDSDRDRNFIVRLDKKSGHIDKLLEVEGSSLYASTFGPINVISTSVEPNPYCPSRECALFVSSNGDMWKRIEPHQKD
ncbi:MAG: hypothetical protein ACWGMZ_10060, partial [Thermoguttaceae bacterium]